MASTEPIASAVALARQCVRTVDALTVDLPIEVGQPLRDGARQDLADAEEMAFAFLPAIALAGMVAESERIRTEAKAARGGEDYYTAEARRLGRE